jgi:hypothetical protein
MEKMPPRNHAQFAQYTNIGCDRAPIPLTIQRSADIPVRSGIETSALAISLALAFDAVIFCRYA